MSKATSRQRCLRSLAILVAVLIILLGSLLVPWWEKMAFYDDRIEQMATRIGKYESMLARKPLLEAELQGLQRLQNRTNYHLSAGTPALAAADLQQRVKRAVEGNGGRLVSTQNLTDPKDEKLVEVVIRVRMNGDVGSVARVLYELESGKPLLLVDNLTIRSSKRYRGRGRNRKVEFHQDTHFDLIGFLKGGSA
jgi:general secretion pathway protein M